MSGIAGLYNVPQTPEEWATWATTHAAHHRDINRRIYELSSGQIIEPEYILDPINFRDIEEWQAQNQTAHKSMDIVLGISGYDLTGVDFGNNDALAAWIQLHSNEHYQAANVLGIG